MPGTDLGDRLDHLLRTVEDGVTCRQPRGAVSAAAAAAGGCAAPAPPRPSRPCSPGPS